jgi:acyl-CoA synthetase (AMP-forming)/AMP-acid ligase II
MTLCYYADIDSVGPLDCMIHAAPLSHATGLYAMPHMAKASHHVIPACQGFDSTELFQLLRYYDNVTLFAVPTMLMRMVDYSGSANMRINPPKTLFYGGAPMYVEDLKRALSCFGPCLVQGYGQGEMPNTITYLSKQMHAEKTHPNYEARLASVGIPRTGVEVRIVDANVVSLPAGEVGEVIARSDICMTGYWQNIEATTAALREGWLYTGDLGVMDEAGFLTLKDRSKDVIISGGSNIYPREVEEALLSHPGVLEVSVVGSRNPEWGEEVVAFVVPREEHVVTEEELDRTCLDRIARFKRPKRYLFIDSLPKSGYGKILKMALREKLQSNADGGSPTS